MLEQSVARAFALHAYLLLLRDEIIGLGCEGEALVVRCSIFRA